MTWSARVRLPSLLLDAQLMFATATLVENYNAPNTLLVTGRLSRLRAAMNPRYGIVLVDDKGVQRFSGRLTSIERLGTGFGTLIYMGDMVPLWWRICYPSPAAVWSTAGQTLVHDDQTAPAETKLLGYIDRNLGPSAPALRRLPDLRVPASSGRGPGGKTSARFDTLGQLVASLAESADLRVRVEQTFDGLTPHLDVFVSAAPDLTSTIRIGTSTESGPIVLGDDWRYRIDIPLVTSALSAAGGQGASRILTSQTDAAAETLWGGRIEQLVDQRDTTDATEIANGLKTALSEGAGPTEVAVPLGNLNRLDLGGAVPLGSKVAAVLDGQQITERVRQMTTTIANQQGAATVATTAILGDPSSGVASPDQKALAAALRRVQTLERI